MIETRTLELDGRAFQCVQFTGTKSLRAYHALAKSIGPTMAVAASGGLSAEVDVEKLVMRFLLDNEDYDRLRGLIMMLLASTSVDGKELTNIAVFDDTFAGPAFFDLAPLLKFVVETNFGDFSKLAARFTSLAADVPLTMMKG